MSEEARSTFSAEERELFEREPELEIETRSPDGQTHRATIWTVVDAGDVFIRSWRGASARWYREIRATGTGVIHAAGRELPVRAIPATDPDSIQRCSHGIDHKYAGSRATRSMLRADVLETTLRLEPG